MRTACWSRARNWISAEPNNNDRQTSVNVEETILVKAKPLEELLHRIFIGVGSDDDEARIVAHHLVDSCLVGHESHGVIRALPYVKAVKKGEMHPNVRPQTLFENGTMFVLDGRHGFGQVAALEATDRAIAKAEKSGLAMYTLRHSGHCGRLGAWAEQAAAAGQATIYFANSVRPGGAQIAPFGGSDRRLNVGPISLGMPVKGADPIVLDISTASVAMGKIRLARNQGAKLREACIVDANGDLTDDPFALDGPPPGALLPFGGHKGYGLCVFTDLFAGILTGAGADYRGESTGWYPINNIMAIHIDVSMLGNLDAFSKEVLDYASWVKDSPPQNPDQPVRLPGEVESENRRLRSEQGIEIDKMTLDQVLEAARITDTPSSFIDALRGPA
jgi:hydroxycarboxylate dehydrogenase B